MQTLNLQLSKEVKEKLDIKLKEQGLTNEEYILKLIEQDIDLGVKLGKGFYYNEYLDKLFNADDEEILLTDIEKKLLLVLIQNSGEVLSSKDIIAKIWEDTESISIYIFRNLINQLRSKTYYNFIINHNNKGYTVNVKDVE